ncbi:hypothetical protein MAR_024133, partial [Mya arenaria]
CPEHFLLGKGEKKAIYQITPDLIDEYVANYIVSKAEKAQKFRLVAEQTNAFQFTRDALRAIIKSLKRLRKGSKPFKASPITDEEINMLSEKRLLSPSSAASFLNTVLINKCLHFGLRGMKNNHDLRWERNLMRFQINNNKCFP